LISHEADVNYVAPASLGARYGTPLIGAVSSGRLDNVKLLLQHGADVNAEAKAGEFGTALIAACATDNTEILDPLLHQDHIVISSVSSVGRYATALIAACANNQPRVVKRLLPNDACVNKTTGSRMYDTALVAAADAVNIRAVLLLLRHGARTDLQATERSSGLHDRRELPVDDLDPRGLSRALARELIAYAVRSSDEDDGGQDGNGSPIYLNSLRTSTYKDEDGTTKDVANGLGFDGENNKMLDGFLEVIKNTIRTDWKIANQVWLKFIGKAEEFEGNATHSYGDAKMLAAGWIPNNSPLRKTSVETSLSSDEEQEYSDEGEAACDDDI
jgi:hypothetical protein